MVSIVTVTYNSDKYIRDTIESVLNQSYTNYEHIIIDGQSTDRTLEIIKAYQPKYNGRMRWISEKDDGIYDAMNKGIRMAKGVVIGILHSDDWYDFRALETLVDNLEEDIDIYHGKIYQISKVGNKYRKRKANDVDLASITKKMTIKHTSCFVSKCWHEKKLYDSSYAISADYKFILDSYLSGARFKYIDYYFTYMRFGGASSINKVTVQKERYRTQYDLLGRKNVSVLVINITIIYMVKLARKILTLFLTEEGLTDLETRNWEELK